MSNVEIIFLTDDLKIQITIQLSISNSVSLRIILK